jgi:hypothetical protein
MLIRKMRNKDFFVFSFDILIISWKFKFQTIWGSKQKFDKCPKQKYLLKN